MPGKKILLYYPPNKRSVAIETLCNVIYQESHELIVLTLTSRGSIHEALEKNGIKTYTHVLERKRSSVYFSKHALFLARFCRHHRIDEIWSHLQEGNIIAIMARPFLKAKITTFRHHAESAFYAEFGEKFSMRRNKKEIFLDKIINKLSPKIVVPSSEVWRSMEKYEGCNMKKVLLLPYIYDFSMYPQPQPGEVQILRDLYSCQLMLIMVSRMIASKQHKPVFEIIKKLAAEGLSIKMIVMDDGPLRPELESLIAANGLSDQIIMTGYNENFINYMAAADLLIHPSVTEASNNVVKEMGLLEKAVAVCRQVGDFSEYIEEDRNGYFLDRNDLENTIEWVIRDAYNNLEKIKNFGKELKKDVLHLFGNSPENCRRFLDLLN